MSYEDRKLHEQFTTLANQLFVKCGKQIGVIQEIVEEKGQDYESDEAGVSFANYFPEGLRDLWLFVHRKTMRLKSLVGRSNPLEGKPNFEKISEEAMELASFALLFSAWAEIGEEGAERKLADQAADSTT